MTKIMRILLSAVEILIKDGYCKSTDELSQEEIKTRWLARKQCIEKKKEREDNELLEKLDLISKTQCHSTHIFIKTLIGKTIEYYADLSMTVADLKYAVFRNVKIPMDQQRIIYAGRTLEDHLTLMYYNIQRESTLHLHLNLRGGMYAESSGCVDLSNIKPYIGKETKLHRDTVCDSCKISGFAGTLYHSPTRKEDFCKLCFDTKIKNDYRYSDDSFVEFEP